MAISVSVQVGDAPAEVYRNFSDSQRHLSPGLCVCIVWTPARCPVPGQWVFVQWPGPCCSHGAALLGVHPGGVPSREGPTSGGAFSGSLSPIAPFRLL